MRSAGRAKLQRFRGPSTLLGALLLNIAVGCTSDDGTSPLPDPLVLGGPGKGIGSFHQPRAITLLSDGTAVVIDRSGRLQTFDPDGRFRTSWRMPEIEEGQPIDCAATPWGTILVGDTHYARLIEFTPDGRELRRFGEDLDLEIVRGVAVGRDGTIFVADYGERDRIHRFERDGRYLGFFGRRGDGEGELLRPEGLAVGEDGDLYVVDCGHHRVLRFRADGTFVASFGGIGEQEGSFLLPMDITAAPDGSLYVVDFQGNRVQRFTSDGRFLGACGGPGTGSGRLATPRGVEVRAEREGHRVVVADTNNHRIQSFIWPDTRGGEAGG